MEDVMNEGTKRERLTLEGGEIIDRVKQLIREGNVRRVVVRQAEHTVAEFPLTAGVVGVVFAPVLAAIGALVALLTHCTIEVERVRLDDEAATDLQAVAATHPRE
jgi:hypothetical protein